jgi:hypothetical protein
MRSDKVLVLRRSPWVCDLVGVPMRFTLVRLLPVLLCVLAPISDAYEKKVKQRPWQTGILVSVKRSTIETGASARISGSGRHADIESVIEERSAFEIDGTDTLYLVDSFEKETGLSAFMRGYNGGGPRQTRSPRVTKLKEPIRYAIEKDAFFILDEQGKEFRGRIVLQQRKIQPRVEVPASH